MIVTKNRRKLTLLTSYKGLLEGAKPPVMPKMRGNPDSRNLMLAPPPSMRDYRAGLPFADDKARLFHSLLLTEANLHTDRDFLVIACSLFGEKPNKHSTLGVIAFIERVFKEKLFDRCVCLGDEAWRFIFGEGYKASMHTIAGRPLYVKQTNYAPVFVFPSFEALNPYCPTGDNRKDWIAHRQYEETINRLTGMMPALKEFMLLTKP